VPAVLKKHKLGFWIIFKAQEDCKCFFSVIAALGLSANWRTRFTAEADALMAAL